jgi:hypothetical protein
MVRHVEQYWHELAEYLITASLSGESCTDSVDKWLVKVEPMIELAQSDLQLGAQIEHLAAQRAFDPNAWRALFQRSIRVQVGTPEAPVLPVEVWLLIGDMCFQDPKIHEDLARRISAFLRTSVLGWMLDSPPLKTSPLTLWLMLAMTLERVYGSRGQSLKIDRVKKHSLRALSSARWAGFWDQWLLLKYEETLLESANPGSSEIDGTLRHLAIHQPKRSGNLKTQADICTSGVKSPDWLDQIMPRTKQA